MSRKLTPVWLLLAFLLAGEARALGLGDIRLQSALNEPLRAEIELISATPEELANLTIRVATAETFERYGIDRPGYLARMTFQIVASGRTDGNVVRLSTPEPVTEPFLTFLVEAVWSRGRLLREYTVLLDPPTFVREPATQAPAVVTAPTRTAPADSGRIERAAPAPVPERETAPAPAPAPRRVTPPSTVQADEPSFEPAPEDEPTFEPAPADESSFQPAPVDEPAAEPAAPSGFESQSRFADVPAGGEYLVQRGDTLWSIATRVRPDSRVTINQTMLAIYEANREAFANNINIMAAGYRLRLPDADDVFRISRGEALAEVQRQHAAWSGRATGIVAEPSQPSLTLVPPDEDTLSPQTDVYEGPDDTAITQPDADPDAARVREIEQLLADHQDALIAISDTELAALRAELARLRGEELPIEAPVEDATAVDGEEVVEDAADDVFVDETEAAAEEDTVDVTETDEPERRPPARVVSTRGSDDSLLDTVIGALTGIWGLIGLALLIVAGVLLWFVRRATRSGDDKESTDIWKELDSEEVGSDTKAATARLRAMARDDGDESIVVVEQRSAPELRRTTSLEVPIARAPSLVPAEAHDTALEDTFSSDTAINLDQSDPVAEADFHMAYGLYDQAADMVSSALDINPERTDLMAKLCEIYFVWGNRDAFIDAARNLKDALDGAEDPEWDKIVIMGRQIAADDDMFSGQTQVGATKAVDLSFEAGLEDADALDMDLAEDDFRTTSDVIDLGGDDETARDDDENGLDFVFDTVNTEVSVKAQMSEEEKANLEAMFDDDTASSPTIDTRGDLKKSTPRIEEQFESLGGTVRLRGIGGGEEIELGGDDEQRADETTEIDLDDLDLDLDSLEETRLAGDLDYDDSGLLGDLEDTAERRKLRTDDLESTGRNLAIDDDDLESTGNDYELDQLADAETRELPVFGDTTGRSRILDDDDDSTDTSLLDATGQTQILPEDFTVGTGTITNRTLGDEDATLLASDYGNDDGDTSDDEFETLLAPLGDEDPTEAGDFDFAKTEALPKDVFDPDQTGRMAGSTDVDMDLDLDDLAAALEISEADTVNQKGEDGTVEQLRPTRRKYSSGFEDDSPTAAISPDDLSDDLTDARTMTEVGTKLDLARAYVDMGDPSGARSILEEVLDEGDESQRQQAKQLLDSLPD